MRYAKPGNHKSFPDPGKLVDIVDLDKAEKKAAKDLGLKKKDLAGLTWKEAHAAYKRIRDEVNNTSRPS